MTDPEAVDLAAVRAGSRARIELEQTEAAFNQLRQAAVAELIATAPDAVAKRERLIVTVQSLTAVQEALVLTVSHGDAAKALAQTGLNKRWG
jgi:hypothetical protein